MIAGAPVPGVIQALHNSYISPGTTGLILHIPPSHSKCSSIESENIDFDYSSIAHRSSPARGCAVTAIDQGNHCSSPLWTVLLYVEDLEDPTFISLALHRSVAG